jgi:EAL domain-containing protein (putative c-di-GMP-specific phosphodiesterase class I)/PAS domain-containing protein
MLSRLTSWLRRRPVRIALSVGLSAALAALLVLTIHYTRFDLHWLAFLGGVLFAAVLALVSQASKAEWLLLRRTRQIERLREQLAEEAARRHRAAQGLQAADMRMRLLTDQLPFPLFYFDRSGLCRYHNRACEEWLALAAGGIAGRPLRDILGGAIHDSVAPLLEQTVAGTGAEFGFAWPAHDGETVAVRARTIPYAPAGGEVLGYYLVLTRTAAAQAAGTAAPPAPDSGEALYLDSIAGELMVAANPREKLEQALSENEFLLFAQKILPLKGGAPEPECYEILLRLKEEEDNLLPPGGFIPVAERYGMLEQIDRWVVKNVVAWSLANRDRFAGARIPMFCINLSAASLQSRAFAHYVHQLLQERGYPARALCFEMSQSDLINFNEDLRQFAASMRPSGCRFSIDDFGSAKVSFAPLRELAVDFIKIDGSIVQNIGRDAAELAKVRAIQTVCQKAGIRTIAEFVESRQTLDTLRGAGIDYVQGFGIARPAPLEQALRLLSKKF